MKYIAKLLFIVFTFLVVGLFIQDGHTEAASKIYREYKLPDDRAKFPVTLSNGLTISTKLIGTKRVPVILKNGQTIWTGEVGTKTNYLRFSVTSNDDTYLYFKSSYLSYDYVQIVGVSKKGHVFFDGEVDAPSFKQNLDFISPSVLEIYYSHTSDYGTFYHQYYQFYKNGAVKELNYFDTQFFSLLKKGQLKWVPGKIGVTFGSFKTKIANFPSSQGHGDNGIILYSNWQATYGFKYANKKKITDNQKVRNISKLGLIATRKQLGPLLSKHLGRPINNVNNTALTYKFGNYYLHVYYFNNGTVELELWDASAFKAYSSY